jgi:hypothetical protein
VRRAHHAVGRSFTGTRWSAREIDVIRRQSGTKTLVQASPASATSPHEKIYLRPLQTRSKLINASASATLRDRPLSDRTSRAGLANNTVIAKSVSR